MGMGLDSNVSRPGLFARKSTGLVREVGRFEAIYLAIFYINIPLGVLVFTTAPYLWPGVNMWLGYLLATAMVAITVLMYSYLSSAMPRSGGDYVFISRSLTPILGSVYAFTSIALGALFAGAFASWMTSLGIAPMLVTLGTVMENDSLVNAGNAINKPIWIFLIGLIFIGLCWALTLRGWKAIIPAMRILLFFVILTLLITLLLMASTNAQEFAKSFSAFASYDEVINSAKSGGFDVGGTSSIGKLVPFLALAWTVLAAFMLPAILGGELKAPKWTPMIGMMGAVVITGVFLAVMGYLCYYTFGDSFLGSMSFLYYDMPDAYPDLPAPFFFLYAMMLTQNTFLLVAIALGFVLAIFTGMFVLWLSGTRVLLAVSLDRVIPAWLAEVSPRFHSPTRINALLSVLAVAAMAFYVFGPPSVFGFIYSLAIGQAVYWGLVALSAVLLAYRKKDIFESSPFSQRVGGIPVMTLLGCASLCVYIFVAYILLTVPDLGANDWSNVSPVIVLLLLGPILYGISKWLNKRHGVDIGMSYTELPPE